MNYVHSRGRFLVVPSLEEITVNVKKIRLYLNQLRLFCDHYHSVIALLALLVMLATMVLLVLLA